MWIHDRHAADDALRAGAPQAAQHRRLYDRRGAMMKALTREYFAHNKLKMIDGSEPVLG